MLRARGSIIACLVFSTGCSDRAPVRVVASSDTIVVNTNDWTPLGIRVLGADGQAIDNVSVSYAAFPDSMIQVTSNGLFSCHEDGVANVLATVGDLHAMVPIRCHLARQFGPVGWMELVAGGPPAALTLAAYDREGRVIDPIHVQLLVTDTSIIRVRDGMVFGLKKGVASIGVQSLAKHGGVLVQVVEPTSADSVDTVSAIRRPPKAQ